MGSTEVRWQEVYFSNYQPQKGRFLLQQVRRKRRWPGMAIDTVESPRVTIGEVMPSPYRLSKTR